MRLWAHARIAAVLLLWSVSAHLASAGMGPEALRILVAVVPLWVAALLLTWRSPWPRLASALLTLVCAGALVLAWSWLGTHLPWLYYLQHLGTHLAVAAWFGRSLAPGREPVVTAMARMITVGAPSERVCRYTRGVTWAWAVFLTANALVSTLLFAWAPTPVWSVHANLLTGPLFALFFAAEMLVRRHRLPPEERPSIRDVVRAWNAQRHPATAPTPLP